MNFEDTQHCDDEERRYYNRNRERGKKKRVESFPIPNRTDIGICWVV
jgi:hypothetical protein